tara:strand:- start:279 stop:437 length:159 start_codon:yes stop_codon:yes gene_type:complete
VPLVDQDQAILLQLAHLKEMMAEILTQVLKLTKVLVVVELLQQDQVMVLLLT